MSGRAVERVEVVDLCLSCSPHGKRHRARATGAHTPSPGQCMRENDPRHTFSATHYQIGTSEWYVTSSSHERRDICIVHWIQPRTLLLCRRSPALSLHLVCRPQDARTHPDHLPAVMLGRTEGRWEARPELRTSEVCASGSDQSLTCNADSADTGSGRDAHARDIASHPLRIPDVIVPERTRPPGYPAKRSESLVGHGSHSCASVIQPLQEAHT